MRQAIFITLIAAACLGASSRAFAAEQTRSVDVLVYGATPGGIAAAVNAARQGASVALVQEDGHIGGLAAGGLSNTDFKSFEALGGTFLEFMQRVEKHYIDAHGPNSQQVIDCVKGGYYEPSVARRVFERMLTEARVEVLTRHRLQSATTTQAGRPRVQSARFINLKNNVTNEIRAKIFVDATYEGDLIAAAGVPYRLGCEARSEFGETNLAFDEPNRYVQTYNFRVCLSRDPANRLPIPKPDGYDRARFAPILDHIRDGVVQSYSQEQGPRPLLKIRPIANDKADFNDVWTAPISMSIENVNHPWPEGDTATRAEIFDIYRDHTLGLFWFLANDPAVPPAFRNEMNRWGLPRDEFVDTNHWTPALYVREGRRLIGAYVFTEHDTRAQTPGKPRAKLHTDSIAIGDYNHNCHGVYSPGPGESSIGHGTKALHGPFQVPYGAIVPREMDGLLAPVPVSASHVGYCALRMEPVWTALGQAAGVAAAMAVRQNIDVRDVDIARLQLRLHELGAKTIYIADLGRVIDVPRPAWDRPGTTFRINLTSVPPSDPYFRAAQFFGTRGFLHELNDDDQWARKSRPGSTGQWGTRFHGHDLLPQKPVDRALAERWLAMARELGIDPGATAADVVEKRMSRGELLNYLFGRLTHSRP